MPATTVSSAVSWGAYLAAAGALALAFTPALSGLGQYSIQASGASTLGAVARVLDELSPGTRVLFSYSLPSPGRITIGGHTLVLTFGGADLTRTCRWTLPSVELSQNVIYSASLAESDVVVSRAG